MTQRTGLAHLKEDFPIFQIKNKTGVSREVPLLNDSVIVPAGTTIDVVSEKILQIPDFKFFKLVTPKLSDLAAYGLVNLISSEPTPAPTTQPTTPSNNSNVVVDDKTGTPKK